MNGLLQFLYPLHQGVAVGLQLLPAHLHALALHIVQHQRQGHLHVPHQLIHAGVRKLFLQHLRRLRRNIGPIAAVLGELVRHVPRRLSGLLLAENLRPPGNLHPQMLRSDDFQGVIALQRIQQIRRYQDIEIPFRGILRQIVVHFLHVKSRDPGPCRQLPQSLPAQAFIPVPRVRGLLKKGKLHILLHRQRIIERLFLRAQGRRQQALPLQSKEKAHLLPRLYLLHPVQKGLLILQLPECLRGIGPCVRLIHLKAAEHIPEFQFLEELIGFFRIKALRPGRLIVDRYTAVCLNRHKGFAQIC